jgi:hypothetical protein
VLVQVVHTTAVNGGVTSDTALLRALARGIDRPEYVVEALLSDRAIGLVVGDSGLGKTATSARRPGSTRRPSALPPSS